MLSKIIFDSIREIFELEYEGEKYILFIICFLTFARFVFYFSPFSQATTVAEFIFIYFFAKKIFSNFCEKHIFLRDPDLNCDSHYYEMQQGI